MFPTIFEPHGPESEISNETSDLQVLGSPKASWEENSIMGSNVQGAEWRDLATSDAGRLHKHISVMIRTKKE